MALRIINKKYEWAYPLTKRAGKPKGIVVHNAASTHCTADDIHEWHLDNGWSGIAYHAFIDKQGHIYRGRPIWATGAHALGAGSWLGICFEGNYDREKTMPKAQLAAGRWLIKRWKKNQPLKTVKRHKDMAGNQTSCPGKWFPWAKLIA